MTEPMPGAGDIAVELDGKEMVLRPTLEACLAISKIAGGLNAAVQRCVALDIDTIVSIVIAGLGLNPNQAKKVPELVYKTGLIALSGPCIDFIHVVANGGRKIEDVEDQDNEPDPPQSPSP